ncbi:MULTISPECIES: diaminopimelate epimerase [unclassified Wenzhouxiangella]|uniref:diaminopimelate epimerase n=1 Tax=unclassified Wenzhouxiangella TaxID=2613841 RepID=UPI0015F274F2|nr:MULTISPECIES: diaminopimelate epimerase [unclassified Wenzhouxiangella]
MPERVIGNLAFDKLEALGNDFMLIDARERSVNLPGEIVRQWADRHRGVGFDQLLVLRPSDDDTHHCRVEIRNGDGSEAEQCGNGMRAVALWLSRHDGLEGKVRLATAAGTVEAHYHSDDEISATLGVPDFSPTAVGLSGAEGFPRQFTVSGEKVSVYGASMGNPHLLLIDDRPPEAGRLEHIGRALGQHPALTHGANVGLAMVESPRRIRLRVFERGAGPTRACGSGACAAAAILLSLDRVENPVEVVQPGGTLVVNWLGPGQPVLTTGPARQVFEGVISCPTQTS